MKHARQMSVWGIVLLLALVGTVGPARGATEAQKQAAIDNGLAYLAGQQAADGRWNFGDDNYDTAATGAALLAFIEEGYSAGTNVVIGATDHGDVVGDGLNWLMTRATPYNIAVEPTGNPDTDGNGIGIKFVPGVNNHRDTYVTGLALPAIAASGTPNKLVTTGPLVGRVDGSGAGGAWTYKDVVQNTMDYFAYGQADPGTWGRGGWRYHADYGESDNSTSQWPIIGALYASSMGATTPAFVRSELDHWISYIQNPGNGGSYYDNNFAGWGSNMSRTGALLIEMAYAGYPGSGAAPVGGIYATENAAYQAALAYINSQWNTFAAGWNGNFNQPYAMWAVYKGLETTIGLNDTTTITPRLQGGAVIDPGDVWNWWEDYCEWLVNAQNVNGSWNGYSNWGSPLATPWHINILNATHIPPVIPEPVTAVGLLLGVGCLARYVRRRRSR